MGKRRLESALEQLGEEVELTYRSFELDPNTPSKLDLPLDELLARKYRTSLEQAQGMLDNMRGAGKEAGIEFNWDTAQTGNTFDSHRLIHHARTIGAGPEMKERLMQAYFTEGRAISDRDTLTEIAGECGLDAAEARAMLDSDQYAAEVRGEETMAHQMGVSGVPFFLIDGKYAVPGAQPVETLLMVFDQVKAKNEESAIAGESCDVDGC